VGTVDSGEFADMTDDRFSVVAVLDPAKES
jgi:hypothetical protein